MLMPDHQLLTRDSTQPSPNYVRRPSDRVSISLWPACSDAPFASLS
jgi:hypothetical protein